MAFTHTTLLNKKKMELAWTYTEKKRRQHCQTSSTVYTSSHRERGRPKIYKKKRRQHDNKYKWWKMKVAAQDRAGWREVVCGLHSTGSHKA